MFDVAAPFRRGAHAAGRVFSVFFGAAALRAGENRSDNSVRFVTIIPISHSCFSELQS